MKTKVCRACGREFMPAMYKQSAEYCDNPECQKAKSERAKGYSKKEKDVSAVIKRAEQAKKSSGNSGRVCAKCGNDPFPNYFYCPVCHKSIRGDDEYEDNLPD